MTETLSFRELAAKLAARLGATGFQHSMATAHTAVGIAEAYGVSPEDARLAGLLHDWARDLPQSELVARAEDRGIPVTDVDRGVPYLLHARVGAAIIAEEYPGLDPAIVDAVARHTVGAVKMTDLDMVVYLADMLEPARDYEGVDQLRSAIGAVSLEELFKRAYAHSVAHVVETRRHLHPDTVAVWNANVAGDRS